MRDKRVQNQGIRHIIYKKKGSRSWEELMRHETFVKRNKKENNEEENNEINEVNS